MGRAPWLTWVITGVLLCLIVAELIYSAYTGAGQLITWRVLVLAVFLGFIAASKYIARIQLGWRGLTIEGLINSTQRDLQGLESLGTSGGTNELEALLEGATGQQRGVWTQLIIYRLALRVLLMRLDRAGTGKSITDMLKSLQQKNLIDPNFAAELDRIREATFFVEWGAGRRPSNEELRRVLSQGPNLLRRLARLIEGT